MISTGRLFTTLVLSFLFALPSQAQEELAPCGTVDQRSPWLQEYQAGMIGVPRNDDLIYVALQIHVVGTDEGTGYMSVDNVMKAYCTLIEDFAPTNIQFYLANPINYIASSEWYEHTTFQQGRQMMNQNNFSDVINCYIVDNAADACGYYSPTYNENFPTDALALSKNCLGVNDHTWAHEVGHYLSLPHPFYGWESEAHDYDEPAPESTYNVFEQQDWPVERADNSNCDLAGDRFCDTAPDYLNYRWNCNGGGFSNVIQYDPDGEPFQSDGTLYMSYSNSSCKNRFSDEQIGAMRANILDLRQNIIAPAPEGDVAIPDVDELTVLSPAPGTILPGASEVTISWEPIPNATHYVVQVNPFNIFGVVFNQYIVEGNSLVFTELQDDETFYFRVRPFNMYNSCTNFTSSASFETGSLVNTNELLPSESLLVFPNPVTEGQLTLQLTTDEADFAQYQLIDALGRVVYNGQAGLAPGNNQLGIATDRYAAGLYTLRVQLEDRQASRKVILQK